jgi:hypothetical protein
MESAQGASPPGAPKPPPPPAAKPSGKYHEVEGPSRAQLRRAAEAPRPVLPKAAATASHAHAPRARERDPLQAPLTGGCSLWGCVMGRYRGGGGGCGRGCAPPRALRAPRPPPARHAGGARAGKPGRLVGSSGAAYDGDVLAGRPHGWGRYYAEAPAAGPAGSGSWTGSEIGCGSGICGAAAAPAYEGEFVRGAREGQGSSVCAATGERYTGQWRAGLRHGEGRLKYAGGAVYEGAWRRGARHGAGHLSGAAGVFVGTWVDGVRQGLGTLYLPGQGARGAAAVGGGGPTRTRPGRCKRPGQAHTRRPLPNKRPNRAAPTRQEVRGRVR